MESKRNILKKCMNVKYCGETRFDYLDKEERPLIYKAMQLYAEQYNDNACEGKTDDSSKNSLHKQSVNVSFCSDAKEEKQKLLTAILYKHTCTVDSCVNEIDYEEVVKDIMEQI